MKNIYFLVPILFFINQIHSQFTKIPDPCFEQNLIWAGIDSDGIINGQVATSDVEEITELRLGYNCITDLTGLQDFKSLKELRFFSDIHNHELTSFDAALAPTLEVLTFESFPNLLDVKVDQAKNLNHLSVRNCQISEIDLSQNKKLIYLDLNGNQIKSINIEQNILLEEVYISEDLIPVSFDALDVSNNSQLRILVLHGLPIKEIDVSNNRELTHLSLGYCQLSNLDVSKNTKLTILDIRHNKLESIDVSQNRNLIQLECFNNQLKSLDVTFNVELTNLQCQDNNISSLNIESNIKLHIFQCYNNELTELYAINGNNSNLEWFDATGNPELTCIEVDDPQMANAGLGVYERWQIDPQVTYSNDCQYILGVNGELSSKEIKVFPNPAENSLSITSKIFLIEKIQIYNTLGQLLIETELGTIGVDGLNRGLYFIRIQTNKGSVTTRFIKN